MRFINYGKKLADSESAKIDYKKRLDIKKRAKEISEIELKMWYEDSVFMRVSGIEYNEQLARKKYEFFLENDKKYIILKDENKNIKNQKEISGKDNEDDDDNDNKPLFQIKFKK